MKFTIADVYTQQHSKDRIRVNVVAENRNGSKLDLVYYVTEREGIPEIGSVIEFEFSD